MRSNLHFYACTLLVAACTKPGQMPVCSPAATWSAPTLRCGAEAAPPAPPPPAAAQPPPPVVEVTPPPPPPPRVEIKEDRLELGETVQFETGSAKLLDQSKSLLDEVVGQLKEHPEITKVQIEGHTDNVAGKALNQRLSEHRAASVKTYLVSQGVEANRLTTKGFGETRPIADNNTEEGRFKNRRVDFKILKRK